MQYFTYYIKNVSKTGVEVFFNPHFAGIIGLPVIPAPFYGGMAIYSPTSGSFNAYFI